jgi:hypothetical protein
MYTLINISIIIFYVFYIWFWCGVCPPREQERHGS